MTRNEQWRLWLTQLRAIIRLESGRNLFSWRSLWVYFLAFAPAGIILLHALFNHGRSRMDEDTMVLAGIVQLYYLRVAVFFGCLGIFSRLIRGEMVERSLHYYLLSPVRREVLLLGKFIAGSIRAILLFGGAVVTSCVLMYLPFGAAGQQYLLDGPGLAQMEAYLGLIVLACLAYGAIFLLFSMLMKNPAPAALVLLGWESISSILPPLLQRFSVSAYLLHLMPVSIPLEGLFSLIRVNTEPVPAWLAVLGVLLLTAGVLVLSCYKMRSLEISYTTE